MQWMALQSRASFLGLLPAANEQLDELSDRIAGYIASKGLGIEDVVSVLIPRCEWMAIASLGVLTGIRFLLLLIVS
jgi:hypothetical protein